MSAEGEVHTRPEVCVFLLCVLSTSALESTNSHREYDLKKKVVLCRSSQKVPLWSSGDSFFFKWVMMIDRKTSPSNQIHWIILTASEYSEQNNTDVKHDNGRRNKETAIVPEKKNLYTSAFFGS